MASVRSFRTTLSWPVFVPGLLLIGLILAWATLAPASAEALLGAAQRTVSQQFGWFYILAVAVFLLTLLGIAVSRYGDIKLGPDDATPAFSLPSWLAMLFAAGMGIGLMYFGVGEPLQHYLSPPLAAANPQAAAQQAMNLTFHHWGLHAWAIYGVVGLVLAYFGFRYRLPLTLRAGLYPILGERIHGPWGHAVDVFALVSTVFGIATTLGFGVMQLAAGLQQLAGIDTTSDGFKLGLIAGVMGLAGLSAATGLDKGVRRLSELNLGLALLLLLFVLCAGPTVYLLMTFSDNLGSYLSGMVDLTFRTFSYGSDAQQQWLSGWTLLYWAWWVSWSPFVGLFIARISRGRTLREFIVGVLLVPTLFNFLWMTVFGNSAIWLDMHVAAGALGSAAANVDSLLFRFFDYLPFPLLSGSVAMLLIAVFFVTSADSGAMVLDSIASGGDTASPLWQRLFWALLLGVTAGVLLTAGGLKALQAMTLVSALPFTAIMLLLCYSLWRGLQSDHCHQTQQPAPATQFWSGHHWQQRLRQLVQRPDAATVQQFIDTEVQPALRTVADELSQNGVSAGVQRRDDGSVLLRIDQPGARDFVYRVYCHGQPQPAFLPARADDGVYQYLAQTDFADGREGYDIRYLRRSEIIADVLKQYERYLSLQWQQHGQLLSSAPAHPG
ncbi:MAG: BCCT family transporter [Vogesella sp.]|uniref:BCCT family transporter n=1 Tax=Vogesella sp. TaxID=1904252 RepID=UPI00391BC645